MRPTHWTEDPPARLRPPPPPTPPLKILWGAFFVSQIEAKALSQDRHPCPKRGHKLSAFFLFVIFLPFFPFWYFLSYALVLVLLYCRYCWYWLAGSLP